MAEEVEGQLGGVVLEEKVSGIRRQSRQLRIPDFLAVHPSAVFSYARARRGYGKG